MAWKSVKEVLIQDYHASDGSPNSVSPYIVSQSFTGSTSTSISYYTSHSVPNSATTDAYIPIDENSSFSTGSFSNTNTWTLSSNSESASITESMSGQPNYIYLCGNPDSVEFDSIAFELGNYVVGGKSTQQIGTVWANLTIDGYTVSWSHAFNFESGADSYYAIITPTYNFLSPTPYFYMSDFSGGSLTLTATTDGSSAYVDAPVDLFTTTQYQGQNVIESSISTTADSVPMVDGYHFGTVSSSISLPSNATAFNINWNSHKSVFYLLQVKDLERLDL